MYELCPPHPYLEVRQEAHARGVLLLQLALLESIQRDGVSQDLGCVCGWVWCGCACACMRARVCVSVCMALVRTSMTPVVASVAIIRYDLRYNGSPASLNTFRLGWVGVRGCVCVCVVVCGVVAPSD